MPLGFGELLGGTQRGSRGEDGDLGDRVGVLAQGRDESVSGFVDGHGVAFLGKQGVGALPPPEQHAVTRGGQVVSVDDRAVGADGVDGGLVDQVGEVCAGKAGGGPGHDVPVHVGGQGLAACVDREDGGPFGLVGQRHRDMPVEAAGTQKRRVEGLGPVGRGEHDNAAALVETVHLRQELVEGLFALVVAAQPDAAAAADSVNLIDEDDRRRPPAGLAEKVTYPGGTHADEHLDER